MALGVNLVRRCFHVSREKPRATSFRVAGALPSRCKPERRAAVSAYSAVPLEQHVPGRALAVRQDRRRQSNVSAFPNRPPARQSCRGPALTQRAGLLAATLSINNCSFRAARKPGQQLRPGRPPKEGRPAVGGLIWTKLLVRPGRGGPCGACGCGPTRIPVSTPKLPPT